MVAFDRASAIALPVSILGFATTAGAGPAQYSGSLVIQGFGNERQTIPPTRTPRTSS